MPIRRITIHACAYGVMLACSAHVLADTSAWNGSYTANDACYCVGERSRNIDSKIVPTPIGGQSVAQVCERVGDGPTLQKINGKFNFTVYADAQCGNGPFADPNASRYKQCLGTLGVDGEDCSARGPRWDLGDAYSKQVASAKKSKHTKNSVVTGGSRYIKPPVKKTAASKDNKQPKINTSVAEIAKLRSNSTKIKQRKPKLAKRAPRVTVPETREQIRARQLEHLAAARKRANLAASKESSESVKGLLPEVAATKDKPKPTTSVPSELAAKAVESKQAAPKDLLPEVAAAKAKPKPTTPDPSEIASKAVKSKEAASKASVDTVADNTSTPATTTSAPTIASALKLPAMLSAREPDFNYVEAAPIKYDFGGAGMSVTASKSSHNRMFYILNAAVADTYREAAIGVGMFFTPSKADRLTFMVRAGLEYGLFNFSNDAVEADLSDTGVFAGLASRVIVSKKFELLAGLSFSSFFEGDAVGYGAANYHLTPALDLTVKAEAGDNDTLGFGIRFHY